jgi:hypothetical protein
MLINDGVLFQNFTIPGFPVKEFWLYVNPMVKVEVNRCSVSKSHSDHSKIPFVSNRDFLDRFASDSFDFDNIVGHQNLLSSPGPATTIG